MELTLSGNCCRRAQKPRPCRRRKARRMAAWGPTSAVPAMAIREAATRTTGSGTSMNSTMCGREGNGNSRCHCWRGTGPGPVLPEPGQLRRRSPGFPGSNTRPGMSIHEYRPVGSIRTSGGLTPAVVFRSGRRIRPKISQAEADRFEGWEGDRIVVGERIQENPLTIA